MATTTITVELPEELVDLLGSVEALAVRTQQALVLDLLREAKISQGKAARLLGVTRYDILDLMARYHILSGPVTADEVDQEIAAVERVARLVTTDAGSQRF